MPDFTFGFTQPMTYPDLKDLQGLNVGTAEPGDIRDLAEAPDHLWRETGGEDRAAKAEPEAGDEPERAADEPGTPEGSAPDPAGPQPAPPAVIAQ